MKTISVRELQKCIKQVVDSATGKLTQVSSIRGSGPAGWKTQTERVVVTRRGEPAAVVFGVEGKDWETVVLETSPAFWELVEARRREPTLTTDELERRLK